ncbi:oxygen-independent coproporphyrinogen-3 oxidase [Lachnotalea glycerini]|uniref:Heme chaperone HemW n=1 Tax=Lachnotalea glycerini TaxID=1763509 RepID=A0A255ILC4_9FIRM|nr:radical SAM family heme chaperone HemW [Lachnotalea glycerini]PXV89488.1 oxygen-independent coproporphyrinogen-3 oxidase [Lachnotalea glycerini]RDY32327.1 oxygen-independent coproporphyrinogen III oxidase [Lachnotalea glycerini]
MEKQELEIYIHIPFCVKKCDYCDFLSFPQLNVNYVPALIREIEEINLMGKEAKNYIVKTIFIGGGTPSILEGEEIALVLKSVYKRFEIDSNVEITIEVNPGTATNNKLKAYQEAGVNRISLGLQSINNEELRELGRIHTYEEFLENYWLARKIGFSNINIDLMSAIPRQTVESWNKVLEKAIKLSPEHLSAYSLMIEEGTKFYDKWKQNILKLPSEEEERLMYYNTKSILEAAGYHRYEISNYCKKGFECKHNVGYWRRVEYIGFGLGGASFINHTRFSNVNNMQDYLKGADDNWEHLHQEIHQLSKQEEMEEFMFLGLRMINGVSIKQFEELFDVTYQSIYGTCSAQLVKDNLLDINGDRICLTEKGIDLSNCVLAEFLL